MTVKNFFNLSLLLLLLGVQSLCSQITSPKVPLSEVLAGLEQQYEKKFNYFEDTVNDILLVAPDTEMTFDEVLEYLRVQTGLIYNPLENDIISVKKPEGEALTLCGYLKDKDTNEPIALATIQSLFNSVVTDELGYFEMPIRNDSEMITIRFLGYKTLQRPYQYFREGCNPVFMIIQEESLSEVILTNYLVEGIDKLNSGSFEVDFSKFTLLPGLTEADVLQTVQALPGIQSINETVSNINIRGGTHDQNLILWDDIKMYQSGHFFGLISAFNPQMTQKVSLRKNGTPASYSDGVSGSIAMKTNENITTQFKGNLGINLVNADAFADIPLGRNSSLEIAARKSISDLVKTPTYDRYFDRIAQDTEVETNTEFVLNSNQDFDFYDTSLRWLYQISEDDLLRLNFLSINNELLFNESAEIGGITETRRSSLSQNSIGGGLYYKRQWNDRHHTSLQVYNTDYKLKSFNVNLLDAQRFLQENVVSETGARIQTNYSIKENFIGRLGYQFIETQVTNLDDVDVPIFRNRISEVVRTHSPYVQVEWNSNNDNSHLNIGFRYNYLDKFSKGIYEPRIAFNQKVSPYFSIDLTGEFKHQITSQVINFQNDFLGIEKRRWQLSNNADIPIIQSKQGSVGFNYSRKGWLVSAEGFYKAVDGITTQSQGFQNQYEFFKTDGSYEVLGLDFLLRKQIDQTNIWVSYAYMDNTYTFESLPEITFPSNLDITHTVTFGITYVYKDLKVSTGLNWRSGKPSTLPVQGNELVDGEINYNPANSSNLEDYLRVDASALYEFRIGKVTVHSGVSVWNVLDQENELDQYFRVNPEGEVEEFVQNALDLTPNAVVRLYF
ncbi:MAG: TonB-dependent receptor plug domain-containing protein [Bacteroidota bacterium]